mmetsp:Transcript_30316/g.31547  ORF Transcript_30316/g.31547 Transcript_30316/m.31547 type:complete len:496 (-) Transcript_30316:67-1554(-)
MECSNSFIEATVTVCQGFFTYYSFYTFGFFPGLCLLITTLLAYRLFLKYIMLLEPLTQTDKILLSDNFLKKQNVLIQLNLENFNTQKLTEALINKAFLKMPKLSKVIVYKFFEFYWKKSDKSLGELIKERIVIHESMTVTELESFKRRTLHILFDVFTCPFQFHIIPATETKQKDGSYSEGYLLIKEDHVMTDGLGLVTMVACLADDYSPKLFPRIMQKRALSVLDQIKDFVLFLLIGVPVIFYIMFYVKSTCKLSNKPRTKQVNYSKTISFDLDRVKKRTKELGISINELYAGALLSTVKQYKKEASQITMETLVGLTPIPEKQENVQLSNVNFGLFNKMTLLTDPIKEVKTLKEDYKKLFSLGALVRVSSWALYFMAGVVPFNIGKELACGVINEVDVILTNIPGVTEPVSIGENKVTAVIPYCTPGYVNMIIPVLSYNSTLRMVFIYDSGQDMDVEFLESQFEKTMERCLSQDVEGVGVYGKKDNRLQEKLY